MIKINNDKRELTDEEIEITQNAGTEAPFSGKYYDFWKDGFYNCVVCGSRLFDSQTKFKSGSGWPSFFDIWDNKNIKCVDDNSLSMKRIEVKCNNCDAHLGHLFFDAPETKTGKRYCINSASLDFEEGDEEKEDEDKS